MDLKRDIKEARKAFRERNKKALVSSHSKNKKIHDADSGKYLKSWVYGGLDGTITTFAVVAGVIGATLESKIILILGFANLVADGISMAIGDYLSTKSEQEYYSTERKREEWEVKNYPKGEENEMLEIYRQKGISKKDSKLLVGILKRNKKFWIDTMMKDELELETRKKSPIKHSTITFISFLIFGFIPLCLYVIASLFSINFARPFLLTSILTGIAMFVLGSAKTKITGKNWMKSGLETLIIGGAAATSAYFIGELLSKIL